MKSRAPWIESHQDLARHPKTKRLARLLSVTVPTTLGHLHLLWWWALEYAEDGNLAGYSAQDLAEAALWEGDAETLVSALVDCGAGRGHGFLDRTDSGDLAIHEWMHYAGRLIRQRQAAVKRTQEWRQEREPEREKAPPVTHNTDVTNAYVTAPPYLTVPNTTIPRNHLRGESADSPSPAAESRSGPKTNGKPLHAEQFVVVARVCGYDLEHLTEPARKEINAAAKHFDVAKFDGPMIEQVAVAYKREMPTCEMTPSALVKHASRLRGQAQEAGRGTADKPGEFAAYVHRKPTPGPSVGA